MMNAYVIKYDYEDADGIGIFILYANDIDDALMKFRKHMFDTNDSKWYERAYRKSEFRLVAKNIYGWHTFYNEPANVCIKIREINKKSGDIIPVHRSFDFDVKEV